MTNVCRGDCANASPLIPIRSEATVGGALKGYVSEVAVKKSGHSSKDRTVPGDGTNDVETSLTVGKGRTTGSVY